MYSGTHIKGFGRGATLGFPTVNISLDALPEEEGVFVARVMIEEKERVGLIHIGARPTFDEPNPSIEIFLLNENSTIPLNIPVHFSLLKKLRSIIKFSSPEALVEQIQKDVEEAKEFLALNNKDCQKK